MNNTPFFQSKRQKLQISSSFAQTTEATGLMSDTVTPGQNPSADTTQPDLPGPDHMAPDPLLQNGSFIYPSNPSVDETLIKPNNNDDNNGNQQPPTNGTAATETPVRTKRRVSETAGDMSWLPPGWTVEDRVRTSGATAGTIDKYYIEPTSGRRFRSKKDVQYYLQTGTVRKKPKATENSDANSKSSENSKGSKNKASTNTSYGWNFDPFNVPDRTEWALTDADKDTWTPSIDGKKVPPYDKEQWEFAFASRMDGSDGNRTH